MSQHKPLVFQDVTFAIVDRSGEPWLRVSQIATAFGYTTTAPLNQTYQRHADEFTSLMTAVVDLDTPGGRQPVRIFSLRGAHLLGMFARTERAKQFRRWVLDILERYKDTPMLAAPNLPLIDKDTELAIKQRARVLADSWYAAYCLQLREQIKTGAFPPKHISSWMPGASNGGPPPANEPRSRWFCWYDDSGFLTMRKLTDDDYIYKRPDIVALGEAINSFMRKYDIGWITNGGKHAKHLSAT